LFPMVSESHAKGEKYTNILLIGFIITLALSGGVSLIYFIIPDVMILILFGSKYLAASSLLGLFGVFMLLYCLCALFSLFYLFFARFNPSNNLH
jgi:O-antigen/teichoic acid export membrane protein